MSMSLKASFVSFLNQKYPQLATDQLQQLISEELLSPFQVSLAAEQIQLIQTEISQYWKLREWGDKNLSEKYSTLGLRKPENFSVCMSYDFHINPEGKPELIEINTNAAFLALGLELYDYYKLPNIASPSFSEKNLIEMFLEEIKLSSRTEKSVAIIDENPQEQRLFIEFLIYKNLFEKNGIQTSILDIADVEKMKQHSLVYNRYTDFYFSESKSEKIRDAYNKNEVVLSPNPYEYFLLSDKQRFLDWQNQSEITKPASLLNVFDLGKSDKDSIWTERKSLFFKPKNSFGSKQVYKGASMSRRVFDEIFNDNFIAQKLSYPSTLTVDFNSAPLELKYDLRCFAYKDQLQLIVARLYQGQTTNLRTPGGGFACIIKK